MSEPPIRTRDVADMYGVSVDTVKRWAEAGHLPHFKTPAGHLRFVRSEIEASIAQARAGDAA